MYINHVSANLSPQSLIKIVSFITIDGSVLNQIKSKKLVGSTCSPFSRCSRNCSLSVESLVQKLLNGVFFAFDSFCAHNSCGRTGSLQV